MEWNSEKIRHLRMLMGWSQGQLADRLSCNLTQVTEWESGSSYPNSEALQNLEFIEKEVHMQADLVLAESIAESILERDEVDQIQTPEVQFHQKESQ